MRRSVAGVRLGRERNARAGLRGGDLGKSGRPGEPGLLGKLGESGEPGL